MNELKEKILIADDDPNIAKILKDRLAAKGFHVDTASDGEECLSLLLKESPPLLILDLQMPTMNGIEVLREIKKHNLETTTIVLTAFGTIEAAVAAMKEGAYDFIQKPLDFTHLEIVISKAAERIYLKKKSESLQFTLDEREGELSYLKREIGKKYDFSTIIGMNKALQNIVSTVKKVVDQKTNIFIQGESGTGKELLAHAIHYNSNRQDKNFVAINCGAIPSELLESEFFGHVEGSFTHAHKTRKGYFEEADGGTLFLDEIGELNVDLQVKLLRALERDEITKVGDTHPKKINVRLITSTHKNLWEQVKQGTFGKDLFYRLYVIPITLPPLRDRKEDIPLLIDHFLKKLNEKTARGAYKISDEAMALFMNYSYPGNVRELENLIERAYLLSSHPLITLEDLPLELKDQARYLEELDVTPGKADLKRATKITQLSAEKQMITNALRSCNYNCSKAAKVLKISRSSFYNKMKKCNINLKTLGDQ
jgi:two-component system NtrC family response regulator